MAEYGIENSWIVWYALISEYVDRTRRHGLDRYP